MNQLKDLNKDFFSWSKGISDSTETRTKISRLFQQVKEDYQRSSSNCLRSHFPKNSKQSHNYHAVSKADLRRK